MQLNNFRFSPTKLGYHSALTALFISLLSACGGGTTTVDIAPAWETAVTDSIIEEHVYSRDATALLMDPWGDLVAVGTSAPIYADETDRKSDLYVSKITQDGDEVWSRLYDFGNTANAADAAVVNPDNGDIYIVSGNQVVAIDRFGSILWETTTDSYHSNLEFHNGLIYLGGGDLAILNTEGYMLQQTQTINNNAWDLQVLGDQSVIIAGQLAVEKYDVSGNRLWSTGSSDDVLAVANILVDTEGFFYVVQNATGSRTSARITKYAFGGAQQWTSKVSFNIETFSGSGLPVIASMPNGNLLLAMSACDQRDCYREISEIDSTDGSSLSKISYGAGLVNDISVLADSRIAIHGNGDLDVFNTETNTRYAFSSGQQTAGYPSGGLLVEGNEVYIAYRGLSPAPHRSGYNKPVIVSRFNP